LSQQCLYTWALLRSEQSYLFNHSGIINDSAIACFDLS
jgi:hypothetical protein